MAVIVLNMFADELDWDLKSITSDDLKGNKSTLKLSANTTSNDWKSLDHVTNGQFGWMYNTDGFMLNP